jgi:hypothetical protein
MEKNMKKILLFWMSLLFLNSSIALKAQVTPYSITFFIRLLPASLQSAYQERIQKIADNPGKLARKRIKREFNPQRLYSGIYVTHLGQVARSSLHGQVTLPRKSADTTLYVLITDDIKPLLINPSNAATLSGFVLNSKAHASYYKYQLVQNPQTGSLAWEISEQQRPKDRIPADALIVFANPKDMFVHLGSTTTPSSDNLILPDMYTTNTATPTLSALRFLKIRKFFHPVTFKYNYLPQGYQERVL